MREIKLLLTLFSVLILLAAIPAASAITVDGVKGAAEWNDKWSFGQTNNATASSEYNVNDLGDRLEVRQGAFGQNTNEWNAEDPKNDSGTNHDKSMAQLGESSGFDIKRIYGYYDATNDTLYGMSTVYGIPGDLDADGDTGEVCNDLGDCNGDQGPAGIGIGEEESWRIRISQSGSPTVEITVQNNNWTVSGLSYNDVKAAFNPASDGVYEIAIKNASTVWNFGQSECPNKIVIEVQAGGQEDGPGEDYASAIVRFPCDEEIPEFPTVALPIAAILGLAFFFQKRRNE